MHDLVSAMSIHDLLLGERQDLIRARLDVSGRVIAAELAQELGVSEDTIRRDLQELADEGKVIKVHGGALSHSFSQVHFPSNGVYSQQQKRKIAQKAISFISNGMFVLTTGGTTILELARCLPPQLKATFISGSIPAILEYMHHPNIDVIMVGDRISKNSKITVGADAIAKVKRIKADICFLGINAIDLQQGITDNDWEVVQLKQAMIETSKLVVCLTIAEKINTSQPLKVCDLDKVDLLITELPPDDPLLEPYAKAGIRIL